MIKILIIAFLTTSVFALDASKAVQKMMKESQQKMYNMIEKDLTPSQRILLKKQMKESLKQAEELSKLTPEEKKKRSEAAMQKMKDPKHKAKMKKKVKNLSEDEKVIMKKMSEAMNQVIRGVNQKSGQ